MHKFHTRPCSARTISSFCQTIIFFGAISIHCGGHHPVSVMVNTLFLKYTSCCLKQFLLAHGYVALTNDMLKAYKVAQV
jgi:hypothetical protein